MKKIFTNKAPAAIGPYSQAIISGNLVFTSGQIPINPATSLVESENIKDQTKQVCENIRTVLEECGTSIDKVVKTVCFLTDMIDFADFNCVYEQYFKFKPARSCVAVKELPKNVLIEIETVAEL